MDHLLIFCPVAHSLWMYMLRLFGIDWVMPGSIVDLLLCWYHWLGKHNSDIWNLVPGCLMWTIWTKRNRCSFEDTGKSLAQLLDLCQWTHFIGLSVGVSRIILCLLLFDSFYSLFTSVTSICFSCYSFFNNIFFLLIKKKKKTWVVIYYIISNKEYVLIFY